MKGEADNQGWTRRWGLPASVVVHALIAALVIFGLPLPKLQPQEEQVIPVTIEPPEPPKKAAPKAPEPTPPPPTAEAVKPAPEKSVPQPMPVLNPVVKFGEKDTGPRQQLDGSAAEDKTALPTQPPVVSEQQAAAEDKPALPTEDEPRATETDGTESMEPSQPDKKAEGKGAAVDQLVVTNPNTPENATSAAQPKSSTPKKAQTAKVRPGAKLQKARTLFSRSVSDDPIAARAMANIPRGVRAGELCMTELRLQLPNGTPPYFPVRVPVLALKEGTILKHSEKAFEARGGQWYLVAFECQLDADATRVVSFAYRVGEPVSMRELEQRGLAPDQ